jgi:hypothetical protein
MPREFASCKLQLPSPPYPLNPTFWDLRALQPEEAVSTRAQFDLMNLGYRAVVEVHFVSGHALMRAISAVNPCAPSGAGFKRPTTGAQRNPPIAFPACAAWPFCPMLNASCRVKYFNKSHAYATYCREFTAVSILPDAARPSCARPESVRSSALRSPAASHHRDRSVRDALSRSGHPCAAPHGGNGAGQRPCPHRSSVPFQRLLHQSRLL